MSKLEKNRYGTIDGLRGLAAISVVLFHLSGNLKAELAELFPDFVNLVISYGYLGVPVFFVISGFVISLSIGSKSITKGYFGSFVLRRSIRLDPTYWVSILIALLLLLFKEYYTGEVINFPSITNILFHMFYLQDVFAISPQISVIYWTLCLEVQLYLFYILSLWLAQKISTFNFSNSNQLHHFIILFLGVGSLLADYNLIRIPISGLFISSWHYFLMGVLVSNAVRKLPNAGYILLFWLTLEIMFQSTVFIKAYSIAGILSCATIYILWRNEMLNKVLTSTPFQFLGKISYTLYLLHPDIGWKVISVGKSLFHGNLTPVIAGMLFLLGITVSIFAAYILHLVVEKPTLILCNKLKKYPLLN
jgi:peptidoglycan/LPS O-acetylase OafA/YrhL